MESRAHQERRSRQRINWRAVLSTTAFVGGLTFIMSGGSPWSTAGTMNAIVGRDVPWSMPLLVFGHFFTSLLYAAILASATYRVTLLPALLIGGAIGLGLSVVSREIFYAFGWIMQSPEIRAVMTHVAFGLFGAAVYKGAAVLPPLESDDADPDAEPIRPTKLTF